MTDTSSAEHSRPADLDLDPSPAARRELLRQTAAELDSFLDSLPSQPAWSAGGEEAICQRLDEPAPESASPTDDVLRLLFDEVIPRALNTAGPGYLAYVPGGGLFSAAIADLIAAAVNRYAAVWVAAPGAVELEDRAIRWLAELLGLPATTRGVLTTGGSMSNLLALAAARERYVEGDPARGTVYVSEETHHSVAKAAHIVGFSRANVRAVPVGSDLRMRVDALEQSIREDRRRGLRACAVCSTAGTVGAGVIDPLDAIADVAEREEIWHHVDGAYGGTFAMVPELESKFRGVERADSFAVDPHKGLFLAYGTGALLVRRLADLRAAFGSEAAYLPQFQDGETHVDYCEVSPELSRPWRGIRLWLPLKLHGTAAFRAALTERRRLAVFAYDTLREETELEFAAPPELSLFAFRRQWRDRPRDEENALNRRLLERINEPRRVYLTGTEIGGKFFIRVCVLHLRTDHERLREGLDIIGDALEIAREW